MGVENTAREPIPRSSEGCLEEAISFLLPLPQVFLLVVMVAGNAVNMSRRDPPPLPRSPRMVPGLSPMFSQSPFFQKSRLCSTPKYFWHEPSKLCCRSCPAGPAHQVVIRNCSITANTQCGCAPGWFPECAVNHCRSDSPFLCLQCQDCEVLHRHIQTPCSREDTVCGKCLPGFCQDLKNNCVTAPCPTPESEKKLSTASRLVPYPPPKPKSTSIHCGNDSGSHSEMCSGISSSKQGVWLQYFLVVPPSLTVLLLLGWGLFYIYRKSWVPKPQVLYEAEMETLKRQWILNPSLGSRASLPLSRYNEACALQLVGTRGPSSPPLAREVSGPEDAWPVLWGQPSSRGNGPGAGTLQPGPQLYEVMDAVPARRWKEFVRTLGLREAEIEAVEAEIGRFRDQQYEMLKRWRQQQPAGLGAVYAALERMGLEGCAEDLRSRLQRGP
ncbi:tumor necrosis factor receptor superfamily member 25 isoform 2-T2 [Sarcophilus harrisii]